MANFRQVEYGARRFISVYRYVGIFFFFVCNFLRSSEKREQGIRVNARSCTVAHRSSIQKQSESLELTLASVVCDDILRTVPAIPLVPGLVSLRRTNAARRFTLRTRGTRAQVPRSTFHVPFVESRRARARAAAPRASQPGCFMLHTCMRVRACVRACAHNFVPALLESRPVSRAVAYIRDVIHVCLRVCDMSAGMRREHEDTVPAIGLYNLEPRFYRRYRVTDDVTTPR